MVNLWPDLRSDLVTGCLVEYRWGGGGLLRTTMGTTVVCRCTKGFGVKRAPRGCQMAGIGEGLG